MAIAGPSTGLTKVWTTLITNTEYLPGLLTLEYSLRRVGSKYPLVVLYTDSFPAQGHRILDARGIRKQHVPYLLPSIPKDYVNDVRFYDCWSKLTPFSLTQYERVVQLDSDMMILQNMDELMEIQLDPPEMAGTGNRVFAASHACVCNPLHKTHYPKDWIPANCAFTTQHNSPEAAQSTGAPPSAGLGMPNGGLQVVNPSRAVYDKITAQLTSSSTSNYNFADQSLLSDVFHGRWVALPYVYNALKTMRWSGVHDAIWRDERVKNIHYILSPKPWDEVEDSQTKQGAAKQKTDPSHAWWRDLNAKRLRDEKERGVVDS
ncbi:glycosyl transferase family protein [Aspergillus taichungensis]|uniref:Glycosyl transferase family protein n=1 Tax=Aspergillus taichungensis TaxID=482145 RepID=A0A2J5HJC6_9EURO|nr:glycosyl transferase family protein [Aspergillus taichungensis]